MIKGEVLMGVTLPDKVPYVKYPDGTKDEIMFSAKNVNMYQDGPTVQYEIEELKGLLGDLQRTVKELQEENALLKTALEGQISDLGSSMNSLVITREKIIEALGFEPSPAAQWVTFRGAQGPTDTTIGQPGTMGLVPQPEISDEKNYLCGDGTWRNIDVSQFITRTEAEMMFLAIDGKAVDSYKADVATTANNIPYTAQGNIWIRENN